MRLKRLLLYFLATLFLAALLLVLIVAWEISFIDGKDYFRSDLTFSIGIPKFAAQFPIIQNCNEPHYNVRGHDGNASGYTTITYQTRASHQDIAAISDLYIRARHCTPSKNHTNRYSCNMDNVAQVDVSYTSAKPCSDIRIDMIEPFTRCGPFTNNYAKVISEKKVPISTDEWPEKQKQYLAKDDVVQVGNSEFESTCVRYIRKIGGDSALVQGWIHGDALEKVRPADEYTIKNGKHWGQHGLEIIRSRPSKSTEEEITPADEIRIKELFSSKK